MSSDFTAQLLAHAIGEGAKESVYRGLARREAQVGDHGWRCLGLNQGSFKVWLDGCIPGAYMGYVWLVWAYGLIMVDLWNFVKLEKQLLLNIAPKWHRESLLLRFEMPCHSGNRCWGSSALSLPESKLSHFGRCDDNG